MATAQRANLTMMTFVLSVSIQNPPRLH